MAEIAFIEALQGNAVRDIGRYQVYTDFEDTQTVVFIHNPTGWGEHKYVFAITEAHTYIVAAPRGGRLTTKRSSRATQPLRENAHAAPGEDTFGLRATDS
jgi:hypothetical protein